MDHNQERRRGHFHRARRGPDRRSLDRRSQAPQPTPPRDQVDVEQIMRDIRGRIAQRQGVEFSSQQIQDLAARKLESILDPRVIKPSLLEALRRGAGSAAQATPAKASSEPIYTFEESTIYDSHRGLMRFIRRLLNPILKLFFNPNPLIRALHLQAKLNVESATRDAERERRQTEWNALHYEVVQRLVTEIARLSMDAQAITMKVESLNARVDFNDRRARAIEGTAAAVRAAVRPAESTVTGAADVPAAAATELPTTAGEVTADANRRRRRRRRGRRSGFGGSDTGSRAQQPHSGANEAENVEEQATEFEASAPPPEPESAPVSESSPAPETTPVAPGTDEERSD